MKRLLSVLLALFVVVLGREAVAQTVLFESATLGPVGELMGFRVDATQWLGVRFTTTSAQRVTRLGGHLAGDGGTNTIFIAIFPIVAGNLPPSPPNITNAQFVTQLPVTVPSVEISIATDFILPAGNWSIVIGSNQAGATATAIAPDNNPDLGTPGYFFYNGSGWANGGINAVRLFAEITPCGDGNVDTGEQCDDGDDNSDTEPDACRTACELAGCGDGVVDGGEECDEGDDNGTGACALDCTDVGGTGGGGPGSGGAGGGGAGGGGAGPGTGGNGGSGGDGTGGRGGAPGSGGNGGTAAGSGGHGGAGRGGNGGAGDGGDVGPSGPVGPTVGPTAGPSAGPGPTAAAGSGGDSGPSTTTTGDGGGTPIDAGADGVADDGGCGCRTVNTPGSPRGVHALATVLAAFELARRRRRRAA